MDANMTAISPEGCRWMPEGGGGNVWITFFGSCCCRSYLTLGHTDIGPTATCYRGLVVLGGIGGPLVRSQIGQKNSHLRVNI
jgi:hypothetical protein